jgi:hypothetical protein
MALCSVRVFVPERQVGRVVVPARSGWSGFRAMEFGVIVRLKPDYFGEDFRRSRDRIGAR